ncbi:MAG: PD40 domain-containing protein, partial [Verrucomicrobiales bacterium]|nr:PD40 domain-containing protein [Verrucomicrobiales bacterium]
MHLHPNVSLFCRLIATVLTLGLGLSKAAVDARLLRYPDVSGTHITFVYAGDIWVVPKTGGTANRLSSPRGEESVPRFSPDGSRVAFTAGYDGNPDAYVVPTAGGPVERMTFHPAADVVSDWFPDGSGILVASRMESETGKYSQFFRVPTAGGMPVRLPVPFGEIGAVSPDGTWLAYTPRTVHARTWKRHRGGTAPDIWLFNLRTWESRNLTDHAAADEFPMWHGRKLYFLSDRGTNQRQNLWVHDLDNGSFRQVTQFEDYDVHTPSIGPENIVFEAGGRIHLLYLADETHRPVEIEVITDLATLRPRNENGAGLVRNVTPSPTGRRVVLESRGELLSAPARHGAVVNLTRSPGVAERFPAWSPDGKHLAYVTDRPGEYQLALRPADGGEETILTTFADGYRYQPFWSPDSRKLAFVDHAFELQVYDLDRKQVTVVDSLRWVFHQDLLGFRIAWSPDSRWLAYSRALDHSQTAIVLHDSQTLERHQVTSGYYQDSQPTFDPEGKYLFYLTSRHLNPTYDDLQNTWIYANTMRIAAVPLRRDVPSPLKTRDDAEGDDAEEKPKKEQDGKSESAKNPTTDAAAKTDPASATPDTTPAAKPASPETSGTDPQKDKPAPVEIHLAEFERRSVLLPPRAGQYDSLTAAKGRVLYLRRPNKGSPEESSTLVFYDLKEREEKTVLTNAFAFTLTADGKKMLVQRKRDWTFVNVAADQKFENPIATSDLEMTVDPVQEWRQIFADAWRFNRDYFYDPSMHGLDWKRVRDQYAALLPHAVTRWDVNFLIGELIGELNASHTYRSGGD